MHFKALCQALPVLLSQRQQHTAGAPTKKLRWINGSGYANLGPCIRALHEKKIYLLAMKLTAIILLTACLHVSATGLTQITLSERNASLQKVLRQIQKQSGYDFLYSSELLQKVGTISVEVKNVSLDRALDQCLAGKSLTYSIVGKTVVIKPREERPIPSVKETVQEPQVFDITGRVIDEQGQGLKGVSVHNKNAKVGTMTDAEGRFTLKATTGDVLELTFVGYTTQTVRVRDENTPVNISMKVQITEMKDMVVVGYGTMKRKDLTGSVASVNTEEIKNTPFVTIDQALSGKAPGVQVVQADGSPGGMAKIRIRGGTSLMGGNDPLYIIDGIPVSIQNRYLQSAAEIVSPVERFGSDNPNNAISGSFARGLNSLGGLSINDIESIDILKDASATAIYGSRAANGVIIITTKKGKKNQKPTLEANYYAGVSTPIKEEVLNAEQYIAVMKEGAKNLNAARAKIGRAPDATATAILNDPNFLGTTNTDWLDHVLQNGFSQNADIALRGGGTASRYTASLGYTSNEGVVAGTDFKRVSGVMGLDNEITDRLRFITHLEYGFTRNRITNGVYSQAFFMPPTLPAYNPDGSIHVVNAAMLGGFDYQGYQNPLLLLKGKNLSNQQTLRGSMSGEYDILRSLKFKSVVSVNYLNYDQDNYTPSVVRIAAPSGTAITPGVATQAHSRDVNLFFENTLTWDKQFNANNRINVLGGTSWQKSRFKSFTASGQGFPDDEYLNNLSSAAVALPPWGTSGQSSLLSFYLRTNYALKEKYLFTFTGRSDISSKFPASNRSGFFPSGGVAWRISEEKFLSGVKWLSELKLRASAGYTGTQNLGDNLFYTLYSPGSYGGTNALIPSQLGNEDLTWETTLQKDAGMDIALFGSRLRAALGVYEKNTEDILYTTAVATSSGFSSLISNIANIRNRGFEIDVRSDFVKRKNFQWTGAVNVTQNRSKVLSVSNDVGVQQNGYVRFGNTALMVGQPLGMIYGRKYEGIIKTEKELEDYKKENLLAGFGLYPYLGIGDARYAVYKSGNMKGRLLDTVIGNAEPKFFGGYTNTFQYKNLSLIALLTFSYGGDILYLADVQAHDLATRGNKSTRILDYWTPENPNSENPRLLLGQSASANTASNNVYDASFIKLKSITLNYDFPQALLSRIKVRNASMYVSASNVFTITKYPGADPEVSNDPYSIIGGYSDVGGYPTTRQFNAGVRLGF
jgi:TonB-dependent starch-binding outer membrane protein SusC